MYDPYLPPSGKQSIKDSLPAYSCMPASVVTASGTIYSLESVLCSGELSTVYLAFCASTSLPVALKLPNTQSPDAYLSELLLRREGRILDKLSHPNIVTLVDNGLTAGGVLFLATELVSIQTLDTILAASGGKLTLVNTLSISLQLARALAHAHKRGILHRDIKPGNVLIVTGERAPRAILFDFGIAYDGSPDDQQVKESGSIFYAAPEQMRCQSSTVQSDIFQLAMLMYEMLSGQLPFGSTMQEALDYRLEQMPLLPIEQQYGGNLPEEVRALLYCCLSHNPKERLGGMRLFAGALERLLAKALFAWPPD